MSFIYDPNPFLNSSFVGASEAGWSDPQMSLNAQNSASNTSYRNAPPSPNTSLLGALPSPLPTNFSQAFSPSTPSPFVAFHFMECTPNITSSIVLGPQFEKMFHVVTNLTTPGFTVIQNGTGKSIAAIGWKPPAFVEMKGTVARQTTKQWLRLSTSGNYRCMEAWGRQYYWVPRHDVICLYPSGPSSADPIARITEGQGTVMLEITLDAIQTGLLEVCIVATVLFGSGYNLD